MSAGSVISVAQFAVWLMVRYSRVASQGLISLGSGRAGVMHSR